MNGIALGLSAGLIVTLFDSFLMLLPKVFIPSDYPFFLIGFNALFWSLFGCLAGIAAWLYFRVRKPSTGSRHFYWFYFFDNNYRLYSNYISCLYFN